MLRINDKQGIVFKKRERWFTADLMKALGLALFLHGCLIAVLKIPTSFDPNILPLLAPVVVEIDLGAPLPKAEHARLKLIHPFQKTETPAFLEIPSQTPLVFEKEIFFWSDPDFSEYEKMDYEDCLTDYDFR